LQAQNLDITLKDKSGDSVVVDILVLQNGTQVQKGDPITVPDINGQIFTDIRFGGEDEVHYLQMWPEPPNANPPGFELKPIHFTNFLRFLWLPLDKLEV
jgi:hypothetical protein